MPYSLYISIGDTAAYVTLSPRNRTSIEFSGSSRIVFVAVLMNGCALSGFDSIEETIRIEASIRTKTAQSAILLIAGKYHISFKVFVPLVKGFVPAVVGKAVILNKIIA